MGARLDPNYVTKLTCSTSIFKIVLYVSPVLSDVQSTVRLENLTEN